MNVRRYLLIGSGLALIAAVVATSAANATPPTSARYSYNSNCHPVWLRMPWRDPVFRGLRCNH